MSPHEAVGHVFPPAHVRADANRLRFFAKATGETRAPYREGETPLAPPTYAFSLAMLDEDQPLAWMEAIGIDISRVLHAEQEFSYHRPIRAGDALVLTRTIREVQDRKGGALTFVVADSDVRDPGGALVVAMRMTLAVRNA